ncbi:MAG: hypothetical protein HY475_00320 [Candidatus Terrybacteria bacterium]|nr:hypothetical protein [Candidatus Terrybacteria bacterium]
MQRRPLILKVLLLCVVTTIAVYAVVIALGSASETFALGFIPGWGTGSNVIADTIRAQRCVPEPSPWEFESELGVPSLGGFSPSGFQFFGWLFFAAMGFAAVLALLMIVVGGVQYMVAAGNTSGQGAAKKRISDALLGLVLALASVLILYTINPDLTRIGAPTLNDAQIEGGVRNDCLDLEFDDIIALDPNVAACAASAGDDQAALNSCMCTNASYFNLTDDDPPTSSCVYTCLNASQITYPAGVCRTECAGVWEDIDGGTSVDSDDANAAACLQCAAQYIINASDGPGDSTYDYCQCAAADPGTGAPQEDLDGNPLAITPPAGSCTVCTGESDCTNLGS